MRRIPVALNLTFALSLFLSAIGCEPAIRVVEPGAAPTSSAIAITADDSRLVIAAEDHDQLLVVDRVTHEVLDRVAVGDAPSQVILDSTGRAIVSTRFGHTVDVVDLERAVVVGTINVGVEPVGLVEIGPNLVAVVLAGERAVVKVNVATMTVEGRFELESDDPRAIAKVGDQLFVSHMTAGVLSRINLATGRVSTEGLDATNVNGPRLHPNLIRSMTVSPDDQVLVMAHSQANADTMRAPIGEETDFNEGCGYSGCAEQLGANTPAITYVDPNTGTVIELVGEQNCQGGEGDMMAPEPDFGDCFDCGGEGFRSSNANLPPNLLNPAQNRFLDLPMNNPVAIALVDGGRGQFVLNQGTQNVVMLRRDLSGTASDVLGFVKVGNGANSIALTSTGSHAYVWNQFDASVTEVEVPKFGDRLGGSGTFVSTGENARRDAEFQPVVEYAANTFAVVEDALPADVSLGRILFHSATDTRISQNKAIGCATCHPDGRSDNRTWQFTFGPRNTPQLGGGILDTAPFHWPGDVADIPDLNRMTVLAFMGGSGMDSESMNSIGAFIDTIRPAPSKTAVRSALTPEEERGMALFNSSEVGCASCHAGSHMTDNLSWDIETKANSNDISAFQTPVLHGLTRSGPYLHDGSAATLLDVVLDLVATDKMGVGSHLSDDQLLDLTAYLETL